jgi:hypothetical protein
MYAFDISFVDQSNQTYYLADRSNAAVRRRQCQDRHLRQTDHRVARLCGGEALNTAGTAVSTTSRP